MRLSGLRLYFLLPFFCSFTCSAQLVGKVISIADGDTFTMLVDSKQIRIRLHGVDCPEKSQDFGNVAKQFLSGYVFGKVVTVQDMDTDRYGRTIGMVTIDGINVNEKLLEAGLAWHYQKYDQNPRWDELEKMAKASKKGLWSKPNSIPPWEYRNGKK